MPPRSIRTFTVLPKLPPRLQALHKLAYNLWLSWNHDATALFRRIDADLWEAVDHSPVKLLGALEQGRLEQLLDDDGFLDHMDRVEEPSSSPTSQPSSASTRASPSTPAASASSPATTSRAPPTSVCRSSASA
jgi:glucan phosphorylase